MREIKFKVWNTHKKEWIVPAYTSFLDEGFGIAINANDILMQYTGLKDKNGKEIWEGDIILDKDYSEKFHYMKKPKAYVVEFNRFISDDFQGLFDSQCEVIGNIYENPTLLN